MPTRIRASSTSPPDERVRIRALVAGGIGDELLTLPALRYLSATLARVPGPPLEIRLAGHELRHELFEGLLGSPAIRCLPLPDLEGGEPRRAPISRCDVLLDLDARSVPRPPAWLAGTKGFLSVKDAGGPRQHWRHAFALAFALMQKLGYEKRSDESAALRPYRFAPTPAPDRLVGNRVSRWLEPARGRLRVAMSPGGVAPAEKRWPLDRFARIALGLLDVGCDVFILGDRGDAVLGRLLKQAARETGKAGARGRLRDLTGRTRLGEVPEILSRMHLHLANDNGLLHIGGALNCPQVGLYLGSRSRHLTPGRRDRRLFSGPRGMEEITARQVAEACGDELQKSTAP